LFLSLLEPLFSFIFFLFYSSSTKLIFMLISSLTTCSSCLSSCLLVSLLCFFSCFFCSFYIVFCYLPPFLPNNFSACLLSKLASKSFDLLSSLQYRTSSLPNFHVLLDISLTSFLHSSQPSCPIIFHYIVMRILFYIITVSSFSDLSRPTPSPLPTGGPAVLQCVKGSACESVCYE
jgi:hypothetical protein